MRDFFEALKKVDISEILVFWFLALFVWILLSALLKIPFDIYFMHVSFVSMVFGATTQHMKGEDQ